MRKKHEVSKRISMTWRTVPVYGRSYRTARGNACVGGGRSLDEGR